MLTIKPMHGDKIMTSQRILLGCLLAMAGCETYTEYDLGLVRDMKGNPPAGDMAVAPKCPAASGLTGTNLVCVDFSKVSGLTDPQLNGWDFTSQCPAGWTVTSGQLQLKTYSTFMGTCDFTMPALGSSDYQEYNTFTLSVIQTVDVNATKQAVNIYLGIPVTPQLMWYTTGTYPKIGTTLQIAKADLPNGGNGMYQPLFQITSNVQPNPNQGWLISSIAVNGSP
jgi:hypothetical protein